MRSWTFENGIEVYEDEYDCDLNKLVVSRNGRLLGYIYPNTADDLRVSISALDAGENPITCLWDDGLGNACNINGWGFETWANPSSDEQETIIMAARANKCAMRSIIKCAASEYVFDDDTAGVVDIMLADDDKTALELFSALDALNKYDVIEWAKEAL